MNYSGAEISTRRTNGDALVASGIELLPVIAKALFSAISDLGAAFGLTPAQVKVLLQLGTRRQMTVGEIAAALDCSMPAASELVDRLVEAGHVHRATDPADRRRVLVAATPASREIGSRLHQLREAQVRHALDQLPPEEWPVFIRALEALVVGLTHGQQAAVADDCHHVPVASDASAPAAAVPAGGVQTTPRKPVSRIRIARSPLPGSG